MSSIDRAAGAAGKRYASLSNIEGGLRSEDFHRKRFDYFRILQQLVIRLLPRERGLSFLDVGCGTGWAVMRVDRLPGGDGAFRGEDIAPMLIGSAGLLYARGEWIVFPEKAHLAVKDPKPHARFRSEMQRTGFAFLVFVAIRRSREPER